MSFMPKEVVNLHKLHIKQTLYYFSGVCFIISAIIYGFDKLIAVFKGEKEDRDRLIKEDKENA